MKRFGDTPNWFKVGLSPTKKKKNVRTLTLSPTKKKKKKMFYLLSWKLFKNDEK